VALKNVPANAGMGGAHQRQQGEAVRELQGNLISGTTSATAGTQTTHAHGLGKVPDRILITEKGNGIVYVSAAADATNIYVSASAASIPFDAWVI
jgi:hypothetical protein